MTTEPSIQRSRNKSGRLSPLRSSGEGSGHLRLFVAVSILTAAFFLLQSAAAHAGPRLILSPNPVRSGEKVVVHGYEFCAESPCSGISILFDSQVVVKSVAPRRDGSFAASFEALSGLGPHTVVAVQEVGPGGSPLQTSAELIVAVGQQKTRELRQVPAIK